MHKHVIEGLEWFWLNSFPIFKESSGRVADERKEQVS
jgi:hypothetical protein